jgi:adenylate cyclase
MSTGPFSLQLSWPARRQLRLLSGLTLLSYMTLHMANHALALVSLDLAESALAVGVAVLHSPPGSLVLYGAVAIHFSLALLAVYDKQSLRMPLIEVVRIAAGFTIPVLLISHLVSTRIAYELFDAAPRYGRVVATIWANDGQARQLALLAPGWLHGCLGVHIAFHSRAWYKRGRPLLWLAAVLLPALAGAGFLAMSREIVDPTLPAARDAYAAALASVRVALYWLYGGALGTVVAARWLRLRGAR